MRRNYKSLTEIISKERAFTNVRRKALEFDISDKFIDIFPELKKVAKAVKVDKRTLYLHVENSVWRCELNLKKNVIVEKVNNHFNEEVIKHIKFI